MGWVPPNLLQTKCDGGIEAVKMVLQRDAIWNGELAQVRIGKSIRVDRNDLETWLARQKVRGPVL